MSETVTITPTSDRELVLCRILDASPAQVYRAWTEPELLKCWFAPEPFITVEAELDVRPGGVSKGIMRGPDGADMPSRGVYLEVVPERRLVFTDAFVEAWVPSAKPFMVVTLTFEPEAGGARTRYVARVTHWTREDCQAHEKMGFHTGWGVCAEQLERVAVGA